MQILRPYPRPTDSESLGMQPSNLCFNKPSQWFWCKFKFDTMWIVLFPLDLGTVMWRSPNKWDTRGKRLAAFVKVFHSLMKEQRTNSALFQLHVKVPGASAATHPKEGRVERQKGPGCSCAPAFPRAPELTNPRDTPTLDFSLYKIVQLLLVGSFLLADKSILTDFNENKHNHGTNNI